VQRKEVLVLDLPIDEQVADVLTKPGRSSSTSVTDLVWQRMPPSLRGSVDVYSFLRHSPDRIPLSFSVMTLIREGICAVGLITQCPMWRAHEDMSRELTLDVTHYGS
jgi:hypothetical protein